MESDNGWKAQICKKSSCGKPIMGRINGRTFNDACKATSQKSLFKSVDVNSWVHLCPACHTYLIATDSGPSFPFMGTDNVMQTFEDWTETQDTALVVTRRPHLHFAILDFTERALKSAWQLIDLEALNRDITTEEVEEIGNQIAQGNTTVDPVDFCKMVCKWGRGHRVLGNLIGENSRYHKRDELSSKLGTWFELVRSSKNDLHIISEGIAIKGLGVSFASKHLRMLDPGRFATLDDVLSKGLGFALNPSGYKLFIETLRQFRDKHFPNETVGRLEAGIFVLIRQSVRQTAEPAA